MLLRTIAVLPIYLFVLCPVAQCADSYQVIRLGDWHGEEVAARSGDEWLGLVVGSGPAELILGKVELENIHDLVVDNRDDEKTGKRVRFRYGNRVFSGGEEGAPIFLVRGKGLSAGVVPSAGAQERIRLYPGASVYIDGKYSLIATGVGIVGQYPAVVDIRDYCVRGVVNESGGGYLQSEKLFCLDAVDHDAGVAEVVFVGDLDRDSIPDIVLSGSDHYNVTALHLFLSASNTATGGGTRWRKMAEFRTTGC